MHCKVVSEQHACFGFNCGRQRLSYRRETEEKNWRKKCCFVSSCLCTITCTHDEYFSSWSWGVWSSFSGLGQSVSFRKEGVEVGVGGICQRWAPELWSVCERCFLFNSTTDFGKSWTQSCLKRLWWFHHFVCDGLRLGQNRLPGCVFKAHFKARPLI